MEGDLVDHEFLEFFDINADGTGDEWFPLSVAEERPYIKSETSGEQYFIPMNSDPTENQLTQLYSSNTQSSPSMNKTTMLNGPQIICKKMVVDDPSLTHGQRIVRTGLTEFAPWTGFDGEDNSDDEDGGDDELTTSCGGIGKKRRRTAKQKPVNPDADLIAAATEENFKLLNLDPESKEGKRQRRRIRNRLSAQFHRERKKNYIVHLENLIKERDLKLQEVAQLIDQLTGESSQLRYNLDPAGSGGSGGSMNTGKSGASYNGSVHYSSTVSTTFTDDEHSLSEDATDGGFNFPTPPPSPMLPMFDIKDNRGRSSLVRKGVSLLSVFFMLGVTLFGPPSTQDNHQNGNSRMTVTAPTMGSEVSYFETPLQMLQLPKPRDNDQSLSSSSLTSSSSSSSSALVKPSHGRVILSTQQQPPQQQQEQPQIIIAPISSKPSLFINTPVFGTASGANLGRSQPMWKYQSHVADLYPSLARFQPPGFATDTDTSDNEFTGGRNSNTTATGATNPKRRHLRSRSDQHSPPSVNVTRTSSVSVNRRAVSPQQMEVKDDEEQGKQEGESMMSLVPVLSTLSSPSSAATGGLLATSTLGESSISNSLPSSSVLSMSRVLLTSGRALLDPAMVMRTGSTAGASMGGGVGGGSSTSDMTSDHRTATALSTWIDRAVGGIGAGATTTTTGNTVSSPPVVSIGVNMGSNINVAAAAGVAGVANSGNMLVMLLPASSVRWGKVWGESSEGTMEALLSGMNVDDKTTTSTTNGTTNENDQANMDQEGMWVEIGCSVFKAQLVRNVTLSA